MADSFADLFYALQPLKASIPIEVGLVLDGWLRNARHLVVIQLHAVQVACGSNWILRRTSSARFLATLRKIVNSKCRKIPGRQTQRIGHPLHKRRWTTVCAAGRRRWGGGVGHGGKGRSVCWAQWTVECVRQTIQESVGTRQFSRYVTEKVKDPPTPPSNKITSPMWPATRIFQHLASGRRFLFDDDQSQTVSVPRSPTPVIGPNRPSP